MDYARLPARRRRPPDGHLDVTPYKTELVAVLRDIEHLVRTEKTTAPLPYKSLERILKRHPRANAGLFSRSQLIAGFRKFAEEHGLSLTEPELVQYVQMRPVRTGSGVTPLTVFTKPFPCPGKCIFCPNDVRMPKSYLSDEPGAQRAEDNAFDPYRQTWSRLFVFDALGHSTDKIELIVLGGTWSFYPEPYRIWFIQSCLDAMNDFGCGIDRRGTRPEPTTGDGLEVSGSDDSYNDQVVRLLKGSLGGRLITEQESATFDALKAAEERNENAVCRCVGLSIETRPDAVTEREVLRLRKLGCTKVQLGIQSLSDDTLRKNQRGHDVSATRRAVFLLRSAGFKIQAHFMPNLLGATPETDRNDFDKLFASADFRPDELKFYPCSLIESAELMRYYERGEWRPYTDHELLSVVKHALWSTPRYCRLSRVIRDIPSGDIVVGNRKSNLREIAARAVASEGLTVADIRSREIRDKPIARDDLFARTTEYQTSTGREIFLEFVTRDDELAGFLRLCLPAQPPYIAELRNSALIREVHVYGKALALGERKTGSAQHQGVGRALIERAAGEARRAGYVDLAVISAVGTRPYYRKLGFGDGEFYQHRSTGELLDPTLSWVEPNQTLAEIGSSPNGPGIRPESPARGAECEVYSTELWD